MTHEHEWPVSWVVFMAQGVVVLVCLLVAMLVLVEDDLKQIEESTQR